MKMPGSYLNFEWIDYMIDAFTWRRPDTAPYLEKLEMEKIARERGEDGKDNRSFLAKYVRT